MMPVPPDDTSNIDIKAGKWTLTPKKINNETNNWLDKKIAQDRRVVWLFTGGKKENNK